MSAALGLFRLQQVDRRLDRARARRDELREILENDAELQAALSEGAVARRAAEGARQDLAEAERRVQVQQIKIQDAESSLYGGSVRNPKELQDLQNDVAALKRHLGTLEERQLDAMLGAEQAEAALADRDAALASLKGRLGESHRTLSDEQGELEKEIDRLSAERQAVVSALARQVLEAYESLRVQRRGVAVAEVSDDACSACGTTLTAALQQSARSTTLMAHCPSCGRILYAD